jgi:hypothetical protein
VAVPLSDSASGSETLNISATAALADSGTGASALVPGIGLNDSGAGSSALGANATAPLSDSGTGTDALAVSVHVSMADSGAGSDDLNIRIGVSVVLGPGLTGTVERDSYAGAVTKDAITGTVDTITSAANFGGTMSANRSTGTVITDHLEGAKA